MSTARHGNADGLSRKPMEAHEDDVVVRQSSGNAAVAEPDDNTDVLDRSETGAVRHT